MRVRVCAVECKALADELEAEDGMFGATVGRRKSCRFRASGLPVPAMVITVLWGAPKCRKVSSIHTFSGLGFRIWGV